VSNITVAAFTHLAFVGLLGVIVSPSHLIDAIGIEVGTELSGQFFYRCLCCDHRASIVLSIPGTKKPECVHPGFRCPSWQVL